MLRGERVTDVALKKCLRVAGRIHPGVQEVDGFLPSEVSKTGMSKSFPRLYFVLSVKGGVAMEFRIVEKPAFNLVGVSRRVPCSLKE